MNVYYVVFLITAFAVFAVYLYDRFTGGKFTLAIIQCHPVLAALTALADAIAAVVPSSQFPVVATVLRAASDAARKAEELFVLGKLPKEERNEYAQLIIADTLKQAGIDVTEQIQEIVDGCIAVVCMLMPHGVEPVVSADESV